MKPTTAKTGGTHVFLELSLRSHSALAQSPCAFTLQGRRETIDLCLRFRQQSRVVLEVRNRKWIHVAIRVDEEADHVKNQTRALRGGISFSARIRIAHRSRGGNAAVYARRREGGEGGTVARSGLFCGEVRRGRGG